MKLATTNLVLVAVEQKKYRTKWSVFKAVFVSWLTMYDET